MSEPALILTRGDIDRLFTFADYVEAVETGFRKLAEGKVEAPPPLHAAGHGGGFHAKAAGIEIDGAHVVAVKVNGNFPGNREHFGLPTIQGALLLFDAERGSLLAIIDSIGITIARTGAATAIAARRLANPDSRVATICGCGEQGRIQLIALRHALPIERAFAYDADPSAAAAFADRMRRELGLDVQPVADLASARDSDAIVTCTTARTPFLGVGDVAPGAFVAAVGADAPRKRELHPALLARARVVVDSLDQCAVMGDLHHALEAGALRAEDVHAELGEILIGARPGRERRDDIFIFDSTGVAIQDVASAAGIYRRAVEAGAGYPVRLA